MAAVTNDGYEGFHLIGDGPFALSYRAFSEHLGGPVVIKVFLPSMPDVGPTIDEFLHDVEIFASVDDDRLSPPLEAGRTPKGHLYLTRGRVAGDNMTRVRGQTTRLGLERVLRVGADLAGAVHALHLAGVIHGAVRPTNAIVENVGAGLLVRLTDPLPASIANAAPGGFRRDPAHVAPEVRTAGQLTPAADVYALGSTLIELLGSEPASPEFDELLRRCLDPLADSRPPINEVVHEIDRLTSNTVAARRGALRPLPASGARPRAPRLVGPNPGLLVPVADASPPALRKVATPGAFNGIDPGFFFSDAEPPIGPSATPSLTDLPADSLTDSPAVERVDERPDEPTAATPPTRRRRRAMVLLAVSAIAVAGAAVVVTRSDPHMPPTGSGLPVVERPTAAVETFVDRGATVTVRQFALVAGPRRYAQLKVAVTVTNTGPHELSVPRGPNGRLVAILGVMGGLDSYIPPAGTEIEPGELAIDPDSLGITTSRRATGVTAVPANPDGMVESFRSTTSTSATNTASRDGSTAPDTMESFPTAFPTRIVPSGGSTGDEPGTAAVFFVPNHSEILGVAVLGRGGAVLAFQSAADWPTLTSANAF